MDDVVFGKMQARIEQLDKDDKIALVLVLLK
jgi:hypothetical protein